MAAWWLQKIGGGLLQTLERLIEEPNLRKTLSGAGVDAVDPLFRSETMVKALSELYQEIL